MTKKILAVADSETTPFKYGRDIEPFVFGFYDGREFIYFWGENCANKLADHVQHTPMYLYAHNGGRFDWFFMLHRMDRDKKFSLINGRIARAMIGKAELYDSYLNIPLPLALHKKDSMDYRIMEPGVRDIPANRKKIIAYLKTDCISLYEWIEKFINRFGRKFTLGAAAFSELKKTGYPVGNKTGEKYDGMFRDYYYGGRCEAIKTGFFPGEYEMVDINSAYPRAMMEQHPFGSKVRPLTDLESDSPYFAKITAISNGAFPFRDDKGKIHFYRDKNPREYYVTGWEVRTGLKTKTLKILKCHEAWEHEETRDFKEHVTKFYLEKLECKKTGDKDNYQFAKLMLNAPYGKFGQNPNLYREYKLTRQGELPLSKDEEEHRADMNMDTSEFLVILGWTLESHLVNGLSLWSRPDPGDKFNNVATAASITGYVRAFLWESICQSSEPLYCDTDSIICRSFQGKMGDNLGDWSLEGVTHEGVYIGGRKLYTMMFTERKKGKKYLCYTGNKKAHKGARLSHEEIMRIAENGETIEWFKPAPSFSLKFGTRFLSRKVKRL